MQEATASKKREGKKSGQEVMAGQQQGEGQGLLQSTQGPLKGRTAKGPANLGAGHLSQDGAYVSVLRHSLALSSCSHGTSSIAL